MKLQTIRPEYVEYIPKVLEDGILYISKRFRTASHLCACGCQTKIVTPIRETEYSLVERDGTVTLRPSIGNWDHACESHYLIRGNRIVWARKMSRTQIERGRAQDDALKAAYFAKVKWPWWRRVLSYLNRRLRPEEHSRV